MFGACCGLLIAAVASGAPADRDPAFGTGGVVAHDFGSDSRVQDVAVGLPDGDLVAAGTAFRFHAGSSAATAFVARHNNDGTFDTAFAGGEPTPGLRFLGGTGDEGAGLAVDSLGRILVALEQPDGGVRVTRLTDKGAMDITFGRGGTTDPQAVDVDSADVVGIGVTADGKPIMVANFFDGVPQLEVLRWTSTGTLDRTFGGDGRITLGGNIGRAATDMVVDASGRVLIALNRFAEGRAILRLSDSLPGTTIEVPDQVETPGMALALAGTDILVGGAGEVTQTASSYVGVHVARLTDSGAVAAGFGAGGVASLTLGNRTAPEFRGLTTTSRGRVVAALRVDNLFATASGTPREIALVRFTEAGNADETFDGGAAAYRVDDLGSGRRVDPLAGVVRTENDKLLLGGRIFAFADDGGAGDEAFLARFGAPGRRPTAALSRHYRPIGDPPKEREYTRPGLPVNLSAAASSDPDGPIVKYEWDLDGQPGFEVAAGRSNFAHAFETPGTHRINVRVTDEHGLTDTAFNQVEVKSNQAPSVSVKAGIDTFRPTTERRTFPEDRPVVFRIDASDPDGSVKSYELDLDGAPGYERTRRSSGVEVYPSPGPVEVGARVTDDEGGTTEERFTITITEPGCTGSRQLEIGRIRAFAECWKRDVSADEKTVTWKASDSPPLPDYSTTDIVAETASAYNEIDFAGRAVINGIVFTDYDFLHIVESEGKPTEVRYGRGRVETVSQNHTRLLIHDGANDIWKLNGDGDALTSVDVRGRYNGLEVAELVAERIELPATGTARLKFYPRLPAVFGGVSADDMVTLTSGAIAGAARTASADCFKASSASLPGLDFLEDAADVQVCTSNDDPGRWSVTTDVDLDAFTGGVFPGLPRVKLQAEIANGELAGAAAAATFNPGIPFAGPVSLTGLDFQLLLAQAQFLQANCVEHVGSHDWSMQALRDAFLKFGMPEKWVYQKIPDYIVDYGTPSTALCGGLKFSVGMSALELARGQVSLGVANYDDGRPDAFRMIGGARIFDLIDLDMRAAVYSNGYMDMRVEGYAEILEFLSFQAKLLLAVDVANERFNAEAFLEACVIPVDLCAGIEALVSNKGIGACLLLDILGADWRPGGYYSWAAGELEVFFSGCDLGPIRVDFSGSGSTIITPVYQEPPGARAFRGAPLAPQTVAAQERHEQVVAVPPGLPGAYIAVRGQNNALAKFTVHGPRGERFLADGPANPKPDRTPERWILHDAKRGVTHVLIPRATGGNWKIVPESGSAPIVQVVSSEGQRRPRITAKLRGKGRNRRLAYRIPAVKGQTVTFEERGPTGKQLIGDAKGSKGTLRFTSAPGVAERRDVVAIVLQDGELIDEAVVATYRAPRTGKPSKPKRVKLRRNGTAITVRWRRAAGAERYVVTAKLRDGRVVKRVLRKRTYRIRRVPKSVAGTISVRGINEVGERGRAGTAKLRAGRKKGKQRKRR